jgi:hypothetical protein
VAITNKIDKDLMLSGRADMKILKNLPTIFQHSSRKTVLHRHNLQGNLELNLRKREY